MANMIGTENKSVKKGININQNKFLKNDRSFSGIGINHYSLALNSIVDMGVGGIKAPFQDVYDIKHRWGLPFIRCSFGWYDGSSWYNNYYQNKTAYFGKLDEVVASAEYNNIGLIPAIFWGLRQFCELTYYVDGVLNPPSALSNKSSRAWQLAAQYITEVVNRYKDSDAIYGWNLGNELVNTCGAEYHTSWNVDGTTASWLNWGARLGGGNYLSSDKLTMSGWQTFTRNAIELIKSLDHSGRIITCGSPLGNSFSVNAQASSSFTADTLAQWNNSYHNLPWIVYRDQNFDLTSGHIYPQNLSNGRFFNGAEKTHAELIALHKSWSDSVNKPFFLEEFGATYHGDAVDETSTDLASETSNFNQAITAITDNNIQLSSIWNYDGLLTGATSNWMKWKLNTPERYYQLEAIATLNATMNN